MIGSILVFKTSVRENSEISGLAPYLDELIDPCGRWIFDLDDCDKILKVVSPKLPPGSVIRTLCEKGFVCEEL